MRRHYGKRALSAWVAFAVTFAGLAILAVLPDPGRGAGLADALRAVERTVDVAREAVAPAPSLEAEQEEQRERERQAELEARAADPVQPPLHGTNPHGQGTVAVVDLAPSDDAPTGGDPAGSDSGEEIVVGRARGEQREDGTYHGHITIVSLFGNEILGVDTDPGESESGPLSPLQESVLDALCDGSGDQICVEVLKADSTTDENGSTNSFGVASATVGGPSGLVVGAGQSNGNISDDGRCQTSHGDSQVANVNAGGSAVASAANSSTDSQACRGEAPTQTNSSSVIGLGGTGVPLPAAGCADGTPDTVTGVPTLAPIVCNADDTNSGQATAPYGVRDALDVFVLDVGGSQVAKTTTAASESRAQAPPAQCADGVDNDGDGVIDANDPGCLSGPDGSYNPDDDDESNPPQCSDTADNDGDGDIDANDPGCLSGPGGAFNPNDDDETDPPECSDTRDNDGDGRADAADPGCLSGPGGTYDPNDDDETNRRDRGDGDDGDGDDGDGSEQGGNGDPECSDGVDNDGDGLADRNDPGCLDDSGVFDPDDDDESNRRIITGSLPRTGTDVLLTLLAGVALLGGGASLRRSRAGAGA